jgi:hypothetical protein
VKLFSSRKCLNEETMLFWKSFHFKKNCCSPILAVWLKLISVLFYGRVKRKNKFVDASTQTEVQENKNVEILRKMLFFVVFITNFLFFFLCCNSPFEFTQKRNLNTWHDSIERNVRYWTRGFALFFPSSR